MSWRTHLEVPLMVLVSSQQIGTTPVNGKLESSTSRLHLKYAILDTQLYISELVILQTNCILVAGRLLWRLRSNRALRCRAHSLITIFAAGVSSATRLSLNFLLTLIFRTILLLDLVFSHLRSQLLDSLVYFPLILVLEHFHSGLALLGSWYRFGGFTWLLLCLERSEILKELTEVHFYKKFR